MTLFILVSSTVIVGYGNYIAQPAAAVQAKRQARSNSPTRSKL